MLLTGAGAVVGGVLVAGDGTMLWEGRDEEELERRAAWWRVRCSLD